jgi:hypothetical protein
LKEDYTNVRVFAFEGARDFESVKRALATVKGPIRVRAVDVKLTPKEFIGLFKRFNAVLTWKDLELEGREYSVTES